MKEQIRKCMEEYELRRSQLWKRGTERDIFGGYPLYLLEEGKDKAEANEMVMAVAEWFDRPHPWGEWRHDGECDFAAVKLARIWHLQSDKGVLEDSTLAAIRRFFLTKDFASRYQSENHALLFHTSLFVMAGVFGGDKFEAYGKTGKELVELEKVWLGKFLENRARYGWGEFDSTSYLAPVWECLACLYDFSPDETVKRLAGMMMDLLLADMAVESLNGMYGGAHGRIYGPQALDHSREVTYPLQYLYLGTGSALEKPFHGFLLDALTCSYRPRPEIVDIALNRRTPYENRERKHLHNVADVLPRKVLEGSIRKYGYWTPDFVMGCVQRQDSYPAKCDHVPHHTGKPVEESELDAAGYAHHQQHQWDLSFATGVTARIFTHHPGKDGTHDHWTGDRLCGCGHFFQNKGALLALYDIPENQPCQYIHAYLPKEAFDEVVEEDGMLFVRAGDGFAVLRILGGYRWTVEGEWKDKEVVSEGRRHGVVCEAARACDYSNFEAFRHAMKSNRVAFDEGKMTLEYQSQVAGTLFLDTRGNRCLDGRDLDLSYDTYDNPYIRSVWGSGVACLVGGEENIELNFVSRDN